MAFDFNGKSIETTDNGYLVNADDWSEELASAMASAESLELTERHFDLINFLREEFFNNAGNQPNTRNIIKGMKAIWNEDITSKTLYDLFPLDPSKQGGRLAGLPESRRKGGY
ncbi:MAG: TusE/DsrC/DsvC family sulfur relay protein [Gammaproteobacteria bacterium]|nr:TusE/DsrC/DsvC family sulfur relay protein [Gammaproteobacteria bacterium]MDH5729978.1 TusE/DsrC/DsvC family sulfur relay protein [Gammaproteobacteria bacterium]